MTDRIPSPAEPSGGPADLSHRRVLRWPVGAAAVLDIPQNTLRKARIDGDAPRLYAIGRALFTTPEDLRDWVLRHELAPDGRLRPATVPKGTRHPRNRLKAEEGQPSEVAA